MFINEFGEQAETEDALKDRENAGRFAICVEGAETIRRSYIPKTAP